MNETFINITNVTNVTNEQKTKITFIELIFYIWIFMYILSLKNKGSLHFTEKKALKKNKLRDTYLKNIIGLDSVKEEIRYYMDFINNKEKYIKWNVKLPKGILLAGPPGTGKTLLVKTMAESLDLHLRIGALLNLW